MEFFDYFFERETEPNAEIVWKLRGISSEDAHTYCCSIARNPENSADLEFFLYTALFGIIPRDFQEFWYMRAILLLNPVDGLPRSFYYVQALASLKHARTRDMYFCKETMERIDAWQDYLIRDARVNTPYGRNDKLYQPQDPMPNTSRQVGFPGERYISSEDAWKACRSLVHNSENEENNSLGHFLYYSLFFTPDFQEFGLWQAMLLSTLRYYMLAMVYLNGAKTLDKYIYERTPHNIDKWRDLLISKM